MATRESIYFSHDADAMNDPKCMLLISQMGMEGYGAFWALVELLRVQPEYKMSLDLIPAIAARLQITEVKLKAVISAYGLFCITEDYFFFSQSLRSRMQLMIEQKNKRIIASKKANEVRWNKANSIPQKPTSSDCYPNGVQSESEPTPILSQRKEKKGNIKKKEYKEKASAFIPPQLSEIDNYCKDRGNSVDASRFYDWYTANGWMVGKNKMKDWKAAVRTWEKEDKSKKQNNQSHENTKQYSKL
ncbi:Lin1244/Lin1753 domain-containing protein [Parabacteroides leei]|uniref:Lin1244/Lin1753 domain-containing protein n=1 Tax=Parabacteroides leei TaxID=2939491 RepID=UPI00324239CF